MLKSMRKSKKSLFLDHFCFPGDAPEAIVLNVVRMEREFDAYYKLSRSMYPSIFNSFPDIQNRKCKKSPFSRTAAHIFVSPGYAPEVITLNVIVWMERQFDAYKLSRCMCPSTYNRL